MSTGEFISSKDPRWRNFLDCTDHDFYHNACYAKLASKWAGGEPWAYFEEGADGSLIVPLVVRNIPDALPSGKDAESPYGYAAPLWSGSPRENFIRSAFTRFVEAGRSFGLVASFLRLHPVLSTTLRESLAGIEGVDVRHNGYTVSIDLNRPLSQLLGEIRNGHQHEIKKLREDGFEVTIDDWSRFEDFKAIYLDTMQRVGADRSYHFDSHYFDKLRECIGTRLHLLTAVSPTSEVASSGLFPVTSGIVQYHLSGTAQQFSRSAASKLILHTVLSWAKGIGAHTLHLGGGLGGKKDSLFRFKKGFGGATLDFHTVRVIHDPNRYRAAVDKWFEQNPTLNEGDSDFFPLYRTKINV